jgi:4-aminobutyrate aminotransferase-like enzyme
LPPYLDRIVFAVTGSEAVERALGFGCYPTVGLVGDFHGHGVKGLPEMRRDVFYTPREGTKAILITPYFGPTCEWLSDRFIRDLKQWREKTGGYIVVDEIQSGNGRTGKWWGFEHYDLEPDMIVGGKGIAGGLPLSFVAGRHEIMDAVEEIPTSTHAGNAICCCGLSENIKYMKDNRLVENAAAMEDVIRSWWLEKMMGELAVVLRGLGLAMAIMMKTKNCEPDQKRAREVIRKAFKRKLLLMDTSAHGSVKIAPPLCITKDQLREGLAILEGCF